MQILWYSSRPGAPSLPAFLVRNGYYVRCAETAESPVDDADAILLELPPVIDEAVVLIREFRRRAADRTTLLALGPWDSAAEIAPLLEAGADDYVHMPCEPEQIPLRLAVAERAAERRSVSAEQRRLEQRVAVTAKTESMAALAGCLAHDFNNFMAVILGNAELGLLDASAGSPVRHSLEQIDRSARRAAELARQMLAFADCGCANSSFTAINLNELVQEMAELLRISLPKSCRIHYHFERPLPLIAGEACQLRQVVMNLLLNAGDALGTGGGTVYVRTGMVEAGGSPVEVTLEIRDDGPGMPAEVQSRIFDPFFTTKKAGRGLGLAAVQGILRRHKSSIEVESELGQGSTFRVVMPVCGPTDGSASRLADSDMGWRGSGTLLLVESQDELREAAQRLLRKAGYTVLDQADADEALETVKEFGGALHAVVLDVNLANADGFDLLMRIRSERPELPVVVWSALDSAAARERIIQLAPGAEIVDKPSHIRDVAIALNRMLAAPVTRPRVVA